MTREAATPPIVLVGLGAVGSATALDLRANRLSFSAVDRDIVEPHNLQVQRLYRTADIGHPKALVAARRLAIAAQVADINATTIAGVVGRPSLVLDATDNLATRFLLNDYCRREGIPWIHASALGREGTVWAIGACGACFACAYGDKRASDTCETGGLLPSTALIVGALQGVQARRFAEGGFAPDFFRLDAWAGRLQRLRVARRPGCPTCAGQYVHLAATLPAVALCGRRHYQIQGDARSLAALARRLARLGPVRRLPGVVHYAGHTFFADGRALIAAPSASRAKSLYARLVGS